MPNIQKLLDVRRLIKLIIVSAAFLVLLLTPSLFQSFNDQYTKIIYQIKGESIVDTNIVLIEITKDDIDNLGGWPLKRSYYALLINKLSGFNSKAIGIEVYLSAKKTAQNIYNDLMLEELRRAKNVVMSSLLWNLTKRENEYFTDTVFYSYLNELDTTFITGHLNYLELNGYNIPLKVKMHDKVEYAFSASLARMGGEFNIGKDFIKANFATSWKRFHSFGLLEFFNRCEADDPELNLLYDKYVLIGVTDPTIARSINSPYDSYLPGIGFHALILDNLLNDNYIRNHFFELSTYIFFLLILFAAFPDDSRKIFIYYPILFLIVLLLSYGLIAFANIELNWGILFIPLMLLLVYEIIARFGEKEEELAESNSEKEILKRALSVKEKKLAELENELSQFGPKENDILAKVNILKNEIEQLRQFQKDEEVEPIKPHLEAGVFQEMIYISDKIGKLRSVIEKISPQEATVLILGESGSGKELVARAIHNLSKRSKQKFVAINCAALTDTLLESELFGHVKGSFTNAVTDKKGLFEIADTGTIFLDEIGETSENFQVKLLRVLQSGEIQKVGATETKIVDVRIVAATNKDLEGLVREKKFREDLYYRLNVINISVPSLRERSEDIPVLAAHFAQKENSQLKISRAVIEKLGKNSWFGNVRELESMIKRAAIFAQSENRDIIQLKDLPEEMRKHDKSDLESLILGSLREKSFSHSSINETAEELGSLNRTVVSENFRGIFFKTFVLNEFNLHDTVAKIAASADDEVIQKVAGKAETYLKNIERDLQKAGTRDFNIIKSKFSSKYKNLPQKYHPYLDEVINHLLSQKPA